MDMFILFIVGVLTGMLVTAILSARNVTKAYAFRDTADANEKRLKEMKSALEDIRMTGCRMIFFGSALTCYEGESTDHMCPSCVAYKALQDR